MLKVYPAPDGCQAAFFRILRLARWRAGRYSSGMSKTYPEWMDLMVRDDGYMPWAEQVQPWPDGAVAFTGARLVFAPCQWDEEPRLAMDERSLAGIAKHLAERGRDADMTLGRRKFNGAIERCGIVLERTVACPGCNGTGKVEHEDCCDCGGHECYECDGAGTVPTPSRYAKGLLIRGYEFNPKLLDGIPFKGDLSAWLDTQGNGAMLRLTDKHGLIMLLMSTLSTGRETVDL